MKHKISGNIRRDLGFFLTIAIAVIFIISTIINIKITGSNVDKLLQEKSIERAETFSDQISSVLDSGKGYENRLQECVMKTSKKKDVVYSIVIRAKDVQAIAHSDTNKKNKIYEDKYTINAVRNGKGDSCTWWAEIQEQYANDIIVPVYQNGELYGGVDLAMVPDDGTQQIINKVMVSQVIILVASIILLIIIINLLLTRQLKPIRKLSKYVESKANLNFDSNNEEIIIKEYAKRTDDIGEIVNSVQKIISNMENNISMTISEFNQIAAMDFSSEVSEEYQGQFNDIKNSIITVIENMNDTICSLKNSADEVTSQSQIVSNSAQALSQGSTEQASGIEELSETFTEISEQIQRIAQNSNNADSQASLVGNKIEESNQQMQKILVAMNQISSQSGEISKIIKTIDDIAFQTNILALNASVEAARAGSAGSGFAVVANEVGNLANKSAEAAKNTSELIQGSIEAVNTGTNIVNQAAETLTTVVNKSGELVETIKDISIATSEQAEAVNQVTVGIEQISSVVQTNAATSEECAAVSETLSEEAGNLDALVSKFKIK